MSDPTPDPSHPGHDLPAHHRQTERRLLIGFFLILFLVGGGLIAWSYGWGGLAGGLVGIFACTLGLAGLAGLLWLLLTWAGRWANRE
jgi:hypothetical protein